MWDKKWVCFKSRILNLNHRTQFQHNLKEVFWKKIRSRDMLTLSNFDPRALQRFQMAKSRLQIKLSIATTMIGKTVLDACISFIMNSTHLGSFRYKVQQVWMKLVTETDLARVPWDHSLPNCDPCRDSMGMQIRVALDGGSFNRAKQLVRLKKPLIC